MADIHETIRRLRELQKQADVARVYVVTERGPECSDPDESWTLSTDPEEAGWCTDSGYSGYGLPKVCADYYAAAVNAVLPLLEYIESVQRERDRLRWTLVEERAERLYHDHVRNGIWRMEHDNVREFYIAMARDALKGGDILE